MASLGKPLRNAPAVLPATLRFIGSRIKHRLGNAEKTESNAAFRLRVETAVSQLGETIAACEWLIVSPHDADWSSSQMKLEAGETVTLLAGGRLHLSKALAVSVGPAVALWYRIGDGELTKSLGSSDTVTAMHTGMLRLRAAMPGAFADTRGEIDRSIPQPPLSGAFHVAVIRWNGDAELAISAAARLEPSLFGPALERDKNTVTPPPGWHYLWRLGRGKIFREQHQGETSDLCCRTEGDVGILQFPVDHALTPELRLCWSWCVDRLPSRMPEHIQSTHDYLSIAIEFDNGLDLTYLWSAALPVGTVFQCPLPWWDERETHWVVRSGNGDLGRWLDEKRDIQADYQGAIGGTMPQRVVAVWLIANTAFQGGRGECRYRHITVQGAGAETVVYP